MKKYLLLIEDESLWERFKGSISQDINSEILRLIKDKVDKGRQRRDKNDSA